MNFNGNRYPSLFFFFCCLFVCAYSAAQQGNPFITNYDLSESITDNQNWAIELDNNEVLLFANRRGIMTYDGVRWKFVKTPDIPYSIVKEPKNGRIFIGCRGDFGYLAQDDRGVYKYNSISGDYFGFEEITHIVPTDTAMFFYSDEVLFGVSLNKLSNIQTWESKIGEPFTGIVKHKNKIFVNVAKLGLHEIRKKRIYPVAGGYVLADPKIIFSIPFDENKVLIGASDNKFHLFDGSTFEPYLPKASKYIAESVISGGVDLSKNEFAIATVTGGCLFIEKKTGKTIHTINYQTGLPDDEIYAIGKDHYGGLWVSHDYGISRIDNTLPVRNFSNYPGLEGNLISVLDFDSTIYISTSEGVYYLSEVEDYEEIEVLVKIKAKPTVKRNPAIKKVPKDKEDGIIKKGFRKKKKEEKGEEKEKKKKKGFFKKLFGKKKKEKEEKNEDAIIDKPVVQEEDEPEETEATEEKPPQKTIVKRKRQDISESKKIYALQSIQYIFKKVEGLNEKCKQLVKFNDRILVATNTGLYEIYDNYATPIVNDRYINHICQSRNEKRFFVGTMNGIFSVNFRDGEWLVENHFDEFRDNVFSIIEDDKQRLWLGCENVAYDVLLDKGAHPVMIKPHYFDTDYSEIILVRNVFGKPFFFLSSGIYSYDSGKDSIYYNETLNKDFPSESKYIFSQENITWVFNGNEWVSLNKIAELISLREVYLELFDNIQNIFVDGKKNMWIIDGNNALFKILSNVPIQTTKDFNIYFREVSNEEGALFSLSKLVLDYDNNSLEFKIAAPFYIKKGSTKYQYYVEGLMKSWKWTTNPSIEFYSIPPGDYTLHIRAKNILGEFSEEKTYAFTITPPFWKSWWFYLLCIIAAVMLVYFLIKFRERNLRRTQKLLEEKVRIRTGQLAAEKEKSEELLLNILPKATAEELKTKGKATPHHYNMVSVMFTDFKGFTQIAESIKAEELVEKLDKYFSKFDEITGKYNVEKIKTIGDAYMCVGGIPAKNTNNPILTILAAFEIQDFMNKMKKEKIANNELFWEVRLGIHSGPLIAGVVGKKKFAYDVWGDTVNTASRMETSGEPGKINISGTTHEFVKKYFDCKYRGKVDAKNKGKIEMYFVNNIKEEYSINKKGIEPNELFWEIINQA